jgi:hypothetical protein
MLRCSFIKAMGHLADKLEMLAGKAGAHCAILEGAPSPAV